MPAILSYVRFARAGIGPRREENFSRLNFNSNLNSRSFPMPSDSLETLHDLFVHELRDLYDAENQLLKALPMMAEAAQNPELKQAFENHTRETKQQVKRLEQVFKGLGEKPAGKSCKAMQGLVAEGKELLEEDADPDVMDAALIVAAQKIEHYEIAGYGSVCTFGRVLGYNDATEILKETMAEEERTDQLLSSMAEEVNPKAESADEAGDAVNQGGKDDELSDLNAEGRQPQGQNRMRSGGGAGRSGARSGGRSKRSSRSKGSSSGRSSSRGKSRRGATARR